MKQTALYRFWRQAEARTGRKFDTYGQLHAWSVERSPEFWGLFAEFADIQFDRAPLKVRGPARMPGAQWFPGARLNYTKNVLGGAADRTAIIACTEDGRTSRLSYADLAQQAGRCANALLARGVREGDRVAAYLVNGPEAVIAFLATAAIGAIWTSCSPDFGVSAAVDRLGQVAPKVFLASDRYQYNGRAFDCMHSVRAIRARLPSITTAILAPYDPIVAEPPDGEEWLSWDAFLREGGSDRIPYASLPFDHPLYVLYSSGTTGAPKAIVHGAGGTLIQHLKEHRLHTGLRPQDTMVYFTSCGWMMWNWLVSALASGCTIVLYDGSPAYPAVDAAWRLAEELDATVFGTSAAYISACMKAGVEPKNACPRLRLRSILSTGSPLSPRGFQWVYQNVGTDLMLASISGGTDIVSCFVLGNPLLPVYAGEIQCIGLGMDVVALDAQGREVIGEKGELVCRTPFPSMPLRFWNDPEGARYRAAYFEDFPGIWRHGDFISINERGGVIVYGRSDATIKPGGVRIGTAEIYRPLEGLAWIADSLATSYFKDDMEQIVLFVVLRDAAGLDDARERQIKDLIRREASPRHVPRMIFAVADIPRTRNGKVAELAVRRLLRFEDVENRDALANPECLAAFERVRDTLLHGQPLAGPRRSV